MVMVIGKNVGHVDHRRYHRYSGDEEFFYRHNQRSKALTAIQAFTRRNIYAALFAFLVVGPLVWMLMDRTQPYVLTEGVTVPKEIRRGEPYRLEWRITAAERQCNGEVYRFLLDANKKIWAIQSGANTFGEIAGMLPGEHQIAGMERVLPKETALGPAEIHIISEFRCNFMQHLWPLVVRAPTVYTTVID